MKMKHKRIWAFWLAVVFCFTAAFYNAPLSLKAAEQENTSEEEIFNDVIIEETNEELPDEETDEELSKDDTSEEISDEPSEQEQTDEEDVNENAKDDNVVDTEDNTSEEDELTENEPLTTLEEENVLELEEETEILLAALPVPDGLYVAEYVSVPSDTQGSGFRIKSGSDPNYSEMAWCFDHGKTRPAIGTPVTKISANDYVGNDDSKYRKVAKALVYLGCFGNTAEYRTALGVYPGIERSLESSNSIIANVLSQIVHGNGGGSTALSFVNWLDSQPDVFTVKDGGNFSKNSLTAKTVVGNNLKSETVRMTGLSTSHGISDVPPTFYFLTVPTGVSIVVSNDANGNDVIAEYKSGTNAIVKNNNYVTVYANASTYSGKSLDFVWTTGYSNPSIAGGIGVERAYGFDAWSTGSTQPMCHPNHDFLTRSFTVTFAGNGCLELKKVSTNPGAVYNCDAYSFKGAEYGVYKTMAHATAKTNKQYSVITDAQGIAYLDNIPTGTYYLRELVAPKGYTLSNEIKSVTVTTANTPANRAKVQFADAPALDPISILVTKRSDNKIVVSGAEYTVKFYKTNEAYRTGANKEKDPAQNGYTVDRWWTFATDENGKIDFRTSTKIAGSDFYLDQDGYRSLPPGTITVQETKAPDGFELDSTIYVKTVKLNEVAKVEASNVKTDVTDEHQYRGDVEFRKLDDNGKPLANVKFEITNDETKESHIVWTDVDGYYSTAASYIPHTKNTNSGEAGDGVWFGDMDLLAKQPTWGALPSGSYTVTELRCDANKNFKNHAPITFEIKTDGELKKIDDIYNYPIKLTTTAVNPVTDTNVAAVGMDLTLMDKVDMQGLELGHNYKLVCKIYSKKDKDFLKKDGVVYEETVPFVADKVDDTKTVTVKVDITDDFAGQDIVFFEYLYDDAYPEIIKEHADESYEEQTIHFVKIGTQAKDAVSESQMGLISETSTIIDTVKYTNLVPNKKYVLKATLMDPSKNEPVMQDGKAIVVEHSFTPTSKDGEEDVEITFNSNVFTDGGTTAKSVTVFEEIFFNEYSLAMECDIKSESQTIKYPTIKTTAKDKATDTHEALAGPVTIVDTISFHGLLPDKEYEAIGTLKYLDGKDVLDANGNKITGTKTFTTDVPDGTVDVEITFDASLLEGETIIVFEDVLHMNKTVAVHHSLEDENQKIFIVKISTTAKDSVSLSHDGTLSETAKIIDTVMYSNTFKSETYEMVGWLMNKKTNAPFKDANGNDIKATKRFVADEAGSVDMEYTINSLNFKDQDVVVFEELYRVIKNDDGTEKRVLVAQHKNINDANQTVHYDRAPKTGDKTPVVFVLVTMVACATGIILLRRRKK